jgi:hypothetical protein
MIMENHGVMILTWETPGSSTSTLRQTYQQSNLVAKQQEMENEMMNID